MDALRMTSPLPAIFDLDIGTDPDDTCVAVMVLGAVDRFLPALLLTNDETATCGRARFLAGLVAAAGAKVPVAAGLPSRRRRASCLVEEVSLCPAEADFEREGVQSLIRTIEAHPRVRYYGLGALTNLDAALESRPDLAERIDLVQMGPALAGAYRRDLPQYNARLDPGAFSRVLARVSIPALVLSHSTWGRYGESMRQKLGIYPDDPLADALRAAGPVPALFVRHLEAWVESGKPCSIMHDPLTVLGSLLPGLVDFAPVDLALDESGWAGLSEPSRRALQAWLPARGQAIADYLAAPQPELAGAVFSCRMSLDTDDERARLAIASTLLGKRGAQIAPAWGDFNRVRRE